MDADPQAEVLLTSSTTYTAKVICYDGISHAEQWRATSPDGLSFRSLELADVDNDGQLEIVAAPYREHTGAPGVYLYVFNTTTGAEEWHSVNLGTYWASLSLLRVANVDDDPTLEMLVAEYDGQLFIHDGITHVQELQTPDLNLSVVETYDFNGDGVRKSSSAPRPAPCASSTRTPARPSRPSVTMAAASMDSRSWM